MNSYGDLLAATKQQIVEVDTATAAQLVTDDHITLDVREPEEFDQGALSAAIHIPRGHLESQIEHRVPERDTKIVVYCAAGARSAFAAKTLTEMGYSQVVSMDGGFTKWKSEGRAWEMPETLTAHQRNRYQRHLLLPEIGEQGQQELFEAKVLLLGAGGLGSPAAMYLAAAGVGTLGIIDKDEEDESNLQSQDINKTRRKGESKVSSP
ncbi:MAG: ThiF family adenylyltransferase, partial [Actinomycetota bacterium]|nr:ThiF family adenylyltransferase [Actinomycetota bacterium]